MFRGRRERERRDKGAVGEFVGKAGEAEREAEKGEVLELIEVEDWF